MTKKFIKDTELVPAGYSNGISTQLAKSIENNGPKAQLSSEEKQEIINNAAVHFGKFLEALGVDWKSDPNSCDTPHRVAKAYVEDLWKGRFEHLTEITAFPSDGYNGIVQESNIPITSMCSHHHQTIGGQVSIAYIPSENGKVIGLSKLNRIVEHFARRGAIQEQLAVAIHNAVDKVCEKNLGVAIMIDATHNCVSCRGVKHHGASMQTTKMSGEFEDKEMKVREFYKNIELAVSRKRYL